MSGLFRHGLPAAPPPGLFAWTPGCTGKQQFADRAAAERALSRHGHLTSKGGRGRLEPYRCRTCGAWHLGSRAAR